MDVDLVPVLSSVVLLVLLVAVNGKQVSSEPCGYHQIYCPNRPGKCCNPPEHPWQPDTPPIPQSPPSQPRKKSHGSSKASYQPLPPQAAPNPPRDTIHQPLPPPHSPPFYPHILPIWTNWYFWVMVALMFLSCMAGCGYWRRRKIYESSASQTLGHAHAHAYTTPTPSDDTPLYGPPMPFLPPVPYPAPPPYSEAARPSYDPLEHHLYDALLTGRSVYDFYDRRHPNAYYDRYFLPDDTSSSETTSLLSYRLHRSCSAHLPRHHSLRKCDMFPPPPYSEVAAKPELYPVVLMHNNGGGCGSIPEVKSTKSMGEGTGIHAPHTSAHWPAICHHYIYRSGSVSTPEGSQSSSYTCGTAVQGEYNRCRVPSPGCVLALASPASSVGPHNSDVSSLPPTSPPSPPAPTSPTLPPSPATLELRDVLQKISQLPGAASPPGLTPRPSPLPQCCPPHYRHSSDHLMELDHRYASPQHHRARRPLGESLSLDVAHPSRPRSLPLTVITPSSPPCLIDSISPQLPASTSTPNLASWPSPPQRTLLVAALVDGERVIQRPAMEGDPRHLAAREEWVRDVDDKRYIWRARDRPAKRV